MRARKHIIELWEQQNDREYLYAGKGKSAGVAARKQAARAELAASASSPIGCAQALLDLIKAFGKISHRLLARKAAASGYPIWMIRLPISNYRLKRVRKIGSNMSAEMVANCGITAGSGRACS